MLVKSNNTLCIGIIYVTCSRKGGITHKVQIDILADSAKSTVHACEIRLMLAHRVPKLYNYNL